MLSAALLAGLALQLAQNPSPMTEDTRAHLRLQQKTINGRRAGRALILGQPGPRDPVILHFHGACWLAEQSVAAVYRKATVLCLNAGQGSEAYRRIVDTRAQFQALLAEAEAGDRPLTLTAYSAGYGAVRAILRHSYDRVHAVLLMDALHSGYANKQTDPVPLEPFLTLATDAAANRKRFLFTHSEVFPGTFASTTESASHLLRQLQLKRRPVLKWGPGGMQQLSEVRRGKLQILGFAGNSAPDHVDHLHGMSTWLKALRR